MPATLPRELPYVLDRVAQRPFVEEVRRRIGHVMEWPVEVVAAGGAVDEVADGDLVADDERHRLVARHQPLERARVPERRLVEALAAGKALLPVVVRWRLAIGLERPALELADPNVSKLLVDEVRDVAVGERDVRGLERARKR